MCCWSGRGRIEDETPFVLKWFVEKGGVEVWSATEGQRKFENSIDNLINYITFWQADTESKNTALRIAERMRQLKEEGAYTGGPIPLGFKLENKGRVSKKGRPVGDLVIDEDAARCVRERIFYRFHNDGYGTYTLTDLLQAEGVKGVEGKPICVAAVKRILHNDRYRGTIVEEEVFDRVQAMLAARADAKNEKRQINLQSRAQALLSGNIFCGHCGRRMTSTVKSGKLSYLCYNKHHAREVGQKTYLADPIDESVEAAIFGLFDELLDRPKDSVIAERYLERVAMLKDWEGSLTGEIAQRSESLSKLKAEIVRALTNDSLFSREDLAENIQAAKDEIGKLEADLSVCRSELADKEKSYQSLEPTYNRFRNWAHEYSDLSREKKRAIICELVSRIELRNGYDVKIEFDLRYEQFCKPLRNELSLLHN